MYLNFYFPVRALQTRFIQGKDYRKMEDKKKSEGNISTLKQR